VFSRGKPSRLQKEAVFLAMNAKVKQSLFGLFRQAEGGRHEGSQ